MTTCTICKKDLANCIICKILTPNKDNKEKNKIICKECSLKKLFIIFSFAMKCI